MARAGVCVRACVRACACVPLYVCSRACLCVQTTPANLSNLFSLQVLAISLPLARPPSSLPRFCFATPPPHKIFPRPHFVDPIFRTAYSKTCTLLLFQPANFPYRRCHLVGRFAFPSLLLAPLTSLAVALLSSRTLRLPQSVTPIQVAPAIWFGLHWKVCRCKASALLTFDPTPSLHFCSLSSKIFFSPTLYFPPVRLKGAHAPSVRFMNTMA